MIEVSLVILSYGNIDRLRVCLEALCEQTQRATDFEVLLVACRDTERIRHMLANLIAPYTLRVICQVGSNPGAARNRGAEASVGRYCLFLDENIIADRQLVAEHLKVQREGKGSVGIGRIDLKFPSRTNAFAHYLAQQRRDFYIQLGRRTSPPSFVDCSSANLSVPRAVFSEVGGFAVDLPGGEGVELGYRLKRKGLRFIYIPDAVGNQDYRKGFVDVAEDIERSGIAGLKSYTRHPAMLPYLRLGAFYDMTRSAMLLRRLLLALNVPIWLLGIASLLLRKRSWTDTWYRFLDSYCYWRGVRRAASDRDISRRLIRSPIILMYHAVGGPGENPSRYVIPRHRLARQLAWLKRRGYQVISLEEFFRYRHEYRLPPACSVIITFDDGYADNRTLAYPILRQHRLPATIFLVSGGLGGTNKWDNEGALAGRALLSRTDIQDMLDGGVCFGTHTRSHVALTAVSRSRVKDEVEGSRADLEQEFSRSILAFAYPHGKYSAAIRAAVKRAGFMGACSSNPGVNDPVVPNHALRRVEIRGTDSFLHFAIALWLGISPQSHSLGGSDDVGGSESEGRADHEKKMAHGTPSMFVGDRCEEDCQPQCGHCYC